jgi:hypothetical protein
VASVVEHLIFAAGGTVSQPQTVNFTNTVLNNDVVLVVPTQAGTTTGTWTVDGTGIGATFSSVGRYNTGVSSTPTIEVFKGTATGDGTISVTFSTTWNSGWQAFLLRGVTNTTLIANASAQPATSVTGPSENAALGQLVIDIGVLRAASLGTWNLFDTYTPGSGWTSATPTSGAATTHGAAWRVPAGSVESHNVTDTGSSSYYRLVQVVVGDVTSTIPEGAGTGTFAFAGTAAGSTTKSGTGTGTFTWSGAAVGSAPGGASGTGTGTWTFTGAAAGTTTKSGTGSGIWTFTGAGVGSDLEGYDLISSPVLIGSEVVSHEGAVTIGDYPVIGSPVDIGSIVRTIPVPVAVPAGWPVEWPITRQAHLMPALSAASPRYTPYEDYTVEREETGRLHTFVGGVDVTFIRNDADPLHSRYADYKSSVPLGPDEASLTCPGWKPWDEAGTGDLSMFTRDAAFEVVMVRPDDSIEPKWEGFLSSEEDSSGENLESYTFKAEGIFTQAMHELYDPPVYLPPTDPLHIVADVLNSVTHRRWNAIPRVNSTLEKVQDRGRPGGSKWQRVQDVLSKAITSDGRQYTLQRVAPYTYWIVLKPETVTADFTVTKGAPGIACSFVVDQSNRRDRIYGRGFAPDGGYWEGRVFPGLEFGIPPTYPMAGFANISVGTTDADTTSGTGVTDWQRQMREIGYPVTVDGVMNANDTQWVTKIQRDAGLTVDGSLGPQTFAATWENNSTDVDLTSYRLPLATLPEVEPLLYSASGAIIGTNPADDPSIVVHGMPEIDFGSGIKKSKAIPQARIILDRESDPGVQVRVTMLTDPHEASSSRFDIETLDNLEIVGHRGSTTFQLSDVAVSELAVTVTGDTKARDHLAVQALLEKNEAARRDVSSRSGTRDVSSLNKSSVVQYESESKAGFVPRTAINGNSGLWTIRKTFVSQVGVAKVEFTATGPLSELVVGLFNRPIRTSVLESLVGDPLASSDGWYDAVETLQEDYGLMEVFGTPENPGGYWPRQKGDGPLTGKLRDSSSSLYDSPFGGFVWVAMFTSQSCWVEGRVFPAVPT